MTALRPILLLLTALSIPTAFAADATLMSKGQKDLRNQLRRLPPAKRAKAVAPCSRQLFQSDYINKKTASPVAKHDQGHQRPD